MSKKSAITFIIGVILGFTLYWRFQSDVKRFHVCTEIDTTAYKLVERENRIENMEKTLVIHYGLSSYEAHYYSIIYDDFAQKYNVPWQIFPAVIRIESNFNPTLTSKKGAKGLSQVMPSTGEEVAKKLNIRFDKTSLWNDIINMILGFTYLCEGIEERGIEYGVYRYIGGPGFDKGRKDVGQYRTNVRHEFIRLTYIYNGVLNNDEPIDPYKIFDNGEELEVANDTIEDSIKTN